MMMVSRVSLFELMYIEGFCNFLVKILVNSRSTQGLAYIYYRGYKHMSQGSHGLVFVQWQDLEYTGCSCCN